MRLADHDVVDTTSTRRSDAERPDRAAPVTSSRCPAVTPPRVRPCKATASGSASAASRKLTPSGIRSTPSSWEATNSANAPSACTLMPGVFRPAQREGRPARHASHSPHRGDGPPTTASPTAQRVTSSPIATTRPDHSCPSTEPGWPQPSRTKWMSLPQIPQWLTSSSIVGARARGPVDPRGRARLGGGTRRLAWSSRAPSVDVVAGVSRKVRQGAALRSSGTVRIPGGMMRRAGVAVAIAAV